ncbi:hypothetical protein IW15_10720 [Chryseobacterium soli]|uniref:Uncharacterized protein n=1 Tax=Chryseobacterium soli TaxID=445961 RepID=A0A086A5T3_9FLAO|nr:hypothetical protein [Chryseobacterium soli]KFF12047.1 hypothetical protein IW15_10720 [Chryseobacterium soli]
MYSISKKIGIREKASIAKTIFNKDETASPSVTTFTCCECGHENTIEIIPYQSGFPIFQVYHEDKVLSKDKLLKKGIVTETSQPMLFLGELTFHDLPTLYFGTDCESCHSKYFCVFNYGEKQPGLTLLEISGVWKYEELE